MQKSAKYMYINYQVEGLHIQQYNQSLLIQHLQHLSVCYALEERELTTAEKFLYNTTLFELKETAVYVSYQSQYFFTKRACCHLDSKIHTLCRSSCL